MNKQLVIIGGGPAGVAASIYAARKKMDFVLVTKDIGGQILTSGDIENYMGFKNIDGINFVQRLIEQLEYLEVYPLYAEVIDFRALKEHDFSISLSNELTIKAENVLICTGADHKKLGVKGEQEGIGKGVSYCYTCDAPFYKNKKVIVVGGGNSGFEAAEQLTNYASSITIIEYTDRFKADESLQNKVLKNEKVKALTNHRVLEIYVDKNIGVTGVKLEDMKNGKTYDFETEGVFVEIGTKPNTELFINTGIKLNKWGEIIIDQNNRTSLLGVYAAGDCTNIFAKQIITAAGEGAKALLSIYHDITYGVSSSI
ncbi:FAD-dependent pyridine nucleotide-disulphide oxidoreductase [Hydrogenobaculum sp. Y04AAS1]|uniref:FAD-dependent oxidoreductase n=1 Tax=Hydrogenobaculum sp. (strain Y04AAS1) TaxID=380749 RepID=UPI00015BCFBF|nr:FAD-dependent pyridine nucleotide-disulphide oxidoreductase [Hydrogenobaculum sp. Y04AAS1]HCT66097.1 pyridine nucleotide-disulfide oxidoreductase [Hydrogenobaculum sp.]